MPPEVRREIRRLYAELRPLIEQDRLVINHSIPHITSYMSEIEKIFWDDLIMDGCRDVYPQYPCGPYFIDFASPLRKLAYELDGAAYHTDTEMDRVRQEYIEAQGYTVIRLTGSDVYRKHQNRLEEIGGFDDDFIGYGGIFEGEIRPEKMRNKPSRIYTL